MVTIWWARFLVATERVVRFAPWLMLFVVTVLGTKAALKWLDEDALEAVEPDRSAWVRCPDRKTVGKGRARATWYCAPDHPDVIAARSQQAAASERVPARP
jgi:hypothetical protein